MTIDIQGIKLSEEAIEVLKNWQANRENVEVLDNLRGYLLTISKKIDPSEYENILKHLRELVSLQQDLEKVSIIK